MFNSADIISQFTAKNGQTIVVRTASIKDLETMTTFMNEISREDTFLTLSGETLSLEDERIYLSNLLSLMQKEDAVKLFAFCGEVMIGNADITRLIRRSKHFGILSISIKKDFRNLGIGKELLDNLIDFAEKMELHSIQLTLFANNESARHLYKKLGFEEVGRIPEKLSYKNELIDEIIMVKKL